MQNKNIINELKRLKFEDFIWIVFIIISILNIYGDYNIKEFLITNNNYYDKRSNNIFKITINVALLIYIYFFIRNYKAYTKASLEDKNLYSIKLLGSSLLIAGILCLLYFQNKQSSFTGSPAI